MPLDADDDDSDCKRWRNGKDTEIKGTQLRRQGYVAANGSLGVVVALRVFSEIVSDGSSR